MCLNPTFRWGPNLSFFGLGPWAIIHGIAKLANTFISQIWTLMVPFERSLSKLSENQKIIESGSTEFKLWQLKEFPFYTCTYLTQQLVLFKLQINIYAMSVFFVTVHTGCWSFLRLVDLTPQDASTIMLGPLPSRSVGPLYVLYSG